MADTEKVAVMSFDKMKNNDIVGVFLKTKKKTRLLGCALVTRLCTIMLVTIFFPQKELKRLVVLILNHGSLAQKGL